MALVSGRKITMHKRLASSLKLTLLCLLIAVTFLTNGGPVFALSAVNEEDRASILMNAPIYKSPGTALACSPNTDSSVSTLTSVELTGNDNTEKAYRFFTSQGLDAKQAAGIVGNAMAESGVNPKSKSKSGYQGIFQWDGKGRFPNLVKWAQGKGLDPYSLEGQLQYSWYEANARTNGPKGSKLSNIDGVKQQPDEKYAAWYWGRYYEIAIIGGSTSETPLTNVQALTKRMNNATALINKYSGGAAAGTPATLTGSTEPMACTGSGEDSPLVDGFVVYSQYDPAWKNLPYGTNRPGTQSTIGESGCGPSAMAMAITNLTGNRVTPADTTKYADEKGMYIPGQGSSWAIVPTLARHWNLRYEPVGKDLAKITAALRAGGVVVTSGKGGLPFTKGGHYIVIRAVTASGKFKVGDSGHKDTNDKEWDPEQLIQSTPGGSAYAVYNDTASKL